MSKSSPSISPLPLPEGDAASSVSGSTTPSPPSSVVSAISQRLSRQTEGAGSIAMLRLAHACFPAQALDSAFDKLLAGPSGGPAFSNRRFTETGRYASAFRSAKADFVDTTLKPLEKLSPPQSLNHPLIMMAAVDPRGESPKYVASNYIEVEMDSLLKVPAPADPQWDLTRDDSSSFFFIRPSSPLSPASTPPSQKPQQSSTIMLGGGSTSSNAAMPNHILLPQSQHSLSLSAGVEKSSVGGSGDQSPALTQQNNGSQSPTLTQQIYPEGASMYIVGETHMAQGDKESNAQMLVQKLLQAERNVRFLVAKEGKDMKDCILGVIFFSSLLSDRNRRKLGSALKYYWKYLPCMWELSRMGRFMGCALEEVHYSAPLMRLEITLGRLEIKMDKGFDELKALIAARRCCSIV